MPMLNVIPAVTSLLMQDRVDVFRRKEVVNGFGEGSPSEQKFGAVPCVVYPGGQNKLDRRPEAQSTEKVIEIVSRFAFRMASKEDNGDRYQADLVAWRGDRYTVNSVVDYSQYGAGFTQAMATAQPVLQKGIETR